MIYEKTNLKNVDYPFKAAMMRGNMPFMNHCHQEMEIILMREGILSVYSGEEKYSLKKGGIWMSPPFAAHGIENSSEDCERLVILLDIRLAGIWKYGSGDWTWIQEIKKHLEERELFSGNWEDGVRRQVTEVIEQMYQEYVSREFAWEMAEKALLNQLLLIMLRNMPFREKDYGGREYVKMEKILEYIALHYLEKPSLQECADIVGFNPTYLSRYFSSNMGITFQEYVKRLKIDRAKWLLATENLSITEVCFQSGFGDVKTFNKLFKKECGKSPSEFRRSRDIAVEL